MYVSWGVGANYWAMKMAENLADIAKTYHSGDKVLLSVQRFQICYQTPANNRRRTKFVKLFSRVQFASDNAGV